jgi:hypothetical protein
MEVPEACTCAFFVGFNQPGVADHVGSQIYRQSSLDAFFGHNPSPTRVISEILFG